MSLAKRDSLWFGLAVIILSLGIGAFSYHRSTGSFAETTGIMTSTEIGALGGRVTEASQRVLYRCSVDGTEYAGEGLARVRGVAASTIRVGGSIPVYFERASPAVSYPFAPPRPWVVVGAAAIFSAFGLVAIIVGWPH